MEKTSGGYINSNSEKLLLLQNKADAYSQTLVDNQIILKNFTKNKFEKLMDGQDAQMTKFIEHQTLMHHLDLFIRHQDDTPPPGARPMKKIMYCIRRLSTMIPNAEQCRQLDSLVTAVNAWAGKKVLMVEVGPSYAKSNAQANPNLREYRNFGINITYFVCVCFFKYVFF